MDSNQLRTILEIGETVGVEFKRCGNKIESDVYETVCSFLNRFGDDVILDVVPAYVTDAIVRRQNTDRYDDRLIVKTNLIDSYEQLMAFGRKNLPDKFFLEEDQRKSL